MPRRRSTRRRRASPGNVLLLLALLLVVYLYRSGALDRLLQRVGPVIEQPGQAPPDPGGAPASPGAIQIYFTTPSLVYPDRPNQRGESPLLQAVLADIDAARSSVDLAAFDLDVVEIADALIRAQDRGASVRVIVDSENLDTPEVAEQTGRLQEVGIAVRFDEREPFMHNKFVVVDRAIAWTGSWNVTSNDTYRNNNNMLRFASSEIAADYAREFEQMFEGRFGTKKHSGTPHPQVRLGETLVEVYFSPQDGVAKHVLQRLQEARSSIHFMTFSFTSDPIAATMVEKARAGLTVQGVFERQNASGTGAEFNTLKQGGVDVLEDGSCYILHHKTIVIDERIVITGSYNFTGSAERDNDENLVIVEDAAIARAYLEEFERVLAQARSPTRCR